MSGEVVGSSTTADGSWHGFYWTNTGGMVDLGTLGGPSSNAFAIDSRGEVAADGDTADGESHAARWTRAGGLEDLGTLGGTNGRAVAIDNSGRIVGYDTYQGFSWTPEGGMISVPLMPTDVGPGGQIVGDSDTFGASWAAAHGMTKLDDLGGGGSHAAAVNPSGLVVGEAQADTGVHAALWATGGRRQ